MAYLSFYLDEEEDAGAILAEVRGGLSELSAWTDVGEGIIRGIPDRGSGLDEQLEAVFSSVLCG